MFTLLALAHPAVAAVIQLPEGGKSVPVTKGVVCGAVGEGWSLGSDRRSVRPPSGEGQFSRTITVKVAANADGCAKPKETITLHAFGAWPELDPAGIVFAPDEGRLELRGRRLKGLQIFWEGGGKRGQESCVDATGADQQQCILPVDRGLPVDVAFRWLPAGARIGPEVATFDATGTPVDLATLTLRPARIQVNNLVPPSAAVEVVQGVGRFALVHPKAVAFAECGAGLCELTDQGVLVRSIPAQANNITVRLRLAPRVSLERGGKSETSVSVSLPIVHCPLAVVSGPPLRDADDAQILVRVAERCVRDARVRWVVSGEPAEVVRRVDDEGAVMFLIRAGRLGRDQVTIVAQRADVEGGTIGSVTTRSIPAPRPRAALVLPGHGPIDFIPTNRDAVLTVGGAGERAKLIPLPVDGAYTVKSVKGQFVLRGEGTAGGFVPLRFAYRVDGLPGKFAGSTIAIISEQVQRALREASVPAAFGETADRDEPLAEVVCADEKGNPQRLTPGKHTRIPFDARDSCRVIIHQERLRPEDGLQEIVLDFDVTPASGPRRSESERMVLRPGGEARTFWLRDATKQFDRIAVRLSHVIDETRYVLSPTARKALPSTQWSATIEGGHARLYATLAIPAGLYRMNEPTGQLTLNFGVLSRITWLNRDGKEGVLGAELGLMGVGLIQRPGGSVIKDQPPTLAAITGFGFRLPLGSGAAVGVHVWGSREFRRAYTYGPDPKVPIGPGNEKTASRWAFYFGPSISIGEAGTNL